MTVRRNRVVSGLSSGNPRLSGCSSQRVTIESYELQPAGCEQQHAKEEPPVTPALDVRRAVRPLPVPNWQVHDAQRQPRRAEEQIEVAERVEVAKISTVGGNPLIVRPAQHFGSAQGVFDRLSKKPRKRQAEELVPEQIPEAHRFLFHRVHEPDAVDELRV